MTLVSSCIVADPPEYTDAIQTRPELSAYGASPPVYNIVIIQTSVPSRPSFQVPVRSEDAGDRLVANLWLDYGSTNAIFLNSAIVPPSTYNDTSDRLITIPWTTVSVGGNGCHSVSMIVAHFNSYTVNSQQVDKKAGDTDAAIVTWWVNVNPDADALTTLSNCPSPQVIKPVTPQ